MIDAIKFNKANDEVFLSINFMNYVDHDVLGKSGTMSWDELIRGYPRTFRWLNENICDQEYTDLVRFIGTGQDLEDQIVLKAQRHPC